MLHLVIFNRIRSLNNFVGRHNLFRHHLRHIMDSDGFTIGKPYQPIPKDRYLFSLLYCGCHAF